MKKLQIIDCNSGVIELERDMDGSALVQYVDDRGIIQRAGGIDAAYFGESHMIKNNYYRPIAEKLVERFEELKHIPPAAILWLQEIDWKPPKNGKKKWQWIARCKKAPPMLADTWGYSFIIEVRDYFFRDMSKEQIIALVYHEMRHIGEEGDILHHDLEDWSNLVATFGYDWAAADQDIENLLDDDFEGFKRLGIGRQLTIYEGGNAAMRSGGTE
jgi:hypothetical protein